VNEPRLTNDGCHDHAISAPYALRHQSESVRAWAGERKPENWALADPNYEATAAADTALAAHASTAPARRSTGGRSRSVLRWIRLRGNPG